MPGKSRNLHPSLRLVLAGLLLVASDFCSPSPVVAQDSVFGSGGYTADRDRSGRTVERDRGGGPTGRDARGRTTDRGGGTTGRDARGGATDRGGGHGGRIGGFGAGLAIGIGGSILEQMTAPRPASGSAEEPQPRKRAKAVAEGGGSAKNRRISSRETTRKAEPRVSEQPRGGGTNGQSGVPPRGESRFVADEVITQFTPNATAQAIDQIAQRYSLTQLESQEFPLIGTRLYRWRVDGRRSLRDVIGRLEDERIVASAQPNYVFTLQEEASGISAEVRGDAAQYVLGKLQVQQAHEVATGRNILIAVIDSEVDAKHPDLDATIVKSFDALGGDESAHKHGTAMAGAIASHGKLLGIAPAAQLLVARAFNGAPDEAKGTSFAIYKSLQWAADKGARVVNMSFCGPADPELHRFLAAAYEKNMVLIAAAGNAGPNSAPLYPAADPNVIAVTATDSGDSVFKMANRGRYVAIAAPGVEILTLAPGESYQIATGTSVATAHVSGVAALVLEHQPPLRPSEVRAILMTTAKPLATGTQSDFGAGLVNAYLAVIQPDGKAASPDEGNARAKK